jgi:hypothetical protein
MTPTVREDCPCPKVTCKRHKLCDECEASRLAQNKLPFCRRPAASLRVRICKLLGLTK